ncbi:MAG: glutathione peroxidase [Clostridiales bacterium]|jgi:glutathione peroxidase|nr:glutathione peroxidase [Clostridiales bacterium]
MSIYDFVVASADGNVKLADFKGKVLLIVNTATACGFTPQYDDLQKLYDKYREQGFEILDFPCNQFGQQAPGTDAEIESFCTSNYGTTFPRFKKIEVNGDGASPLYKWLKEQKGGMLGDTIKWNFTKFLINRDGKVVARFSSAKTPAALDKEIKKLLGDSK